MGAATGRRWPAEISTAKMKWATIDPRASLLGTLKRPLSAKQKAEGKVCAASGSAVDEDEDEFSLSSVPLGLKDLRPPRPVHSTSPCGHNYSPAPWPLRPTASEEMCVQMEVQVKALVH